MERVFAAAEKTGGVEYYLIEQEGSDFSEFETAQQCLDDLSKDALHEDVEAAALRSDSSVR